MILKKEMFYLDSRDASFDGCSRFYGYTFQDGGLRHYKQGLPDLKTLFSSFTTNEGVFCCTLVNDEELIIFSDPLAQYPVFYFEDSSGNWAVSNDAFTISKNWGLGIDSDSVYEAITYFSPLACKTAIEGVRVLRPYEYVVIDMRTRRFRLVSKIEFLREKRESYEDLFEKCVHRFKERAAAVLEVGKPVIHLTGGQDSRLSLASFLSVANSDDFFVTCLGGLGSKDLKVFSHLVNRYNLHQGRMFLSSGKPRNFQELDKVALEFNGLKYSSHSNYGMSFEPDHVEVTGYFSGGLLKGFGNYTRDGMFKPFDYAKRISWVPDLVFDAVSYRLFSELGYFRSKGFEYSDSLNLLYISNRSKAHFGAQSMVNNKAFLSVDVLYDPLLFKLQSLSDIDTRYLGQGALIAELTEAIFDQDLAYFPLADRKLLKHKEVHTKLDVDAFTGMAADLSDTVKIIKNLPFKSKASSGSSGPYLTYQQFMASDQFQRFIDQYPLLSVLQEADPKGYRRAPELEAILAIGSVWMQLCPN